MKVSDPFRRLASPLFWSLLVAPGFACSAQNTNEIPASGGSAGQIGAAQGGANGGKSAVGQGGTGGSPVATGGAPATGGALATGGTPTGGTLATGGLPSTGGVVVATGGALASGGAAGGQGGRGGQAAAGTGGMASAGSGNAAGRSSGGGGGAAGSGGQASAGKGGASGGASGGGGSGGNSAVCEMVRAEYAAELAKNLACQGSGQCTNRVAAAPGCECLVFIQPTDPFAIEHLSNLADGWFKSDCAMPMCPARCTTASTGTCQSGRCVTP